MRIAFAIGGILIVAGSFLPWATFNNLFLQYFAELTGADLGHGLLTAVAGVSIALLSSSAALRLVATRSRRGALFAGLIILAAVAPGGLRIDRQPVPFLAAIAIMLGPSEGAIRRTARAPGRAALVLALAVLADLVVVAIGFALHNPDDDGLLFEVIGSGLMLVAAGAILVAIAAAPAWRVQPAVDG